MQAYKLVSYFLKSYPKRSIVMVLCMVGSGFFEGLSLVSLMPLLQLFLEGESASKSTAFIFINDFLFLFGLEPTLGVLLILVTVGIVFKALFLLTANILTGFSVAYVTSDLRLNLIKAIMNAQWEFFIKQPVGSFSNAITSEALRVASAFHHVALLLATMIQITIYILAAMIISWEISLFAILTGAILLAALKGIINMSRTAGERQTKLMNSLNASLADALYGIKAIKAMALESRFKVILDKDIMLINSAEKKKTIAASIMQAIQEPILVIIIALGLYFSVTVWKVPMAGLLVTAFLFYRLSGRILNAQICYQEIITEESALWSIDDRISSAELAFEKNHGFIKPDLNGGIHFEHVNFGYSNNVILQDTCIEVPNGKITIIYGPSGIGKTTIADLIVGLQKAQSGIIKIGKNSIDDIDLTKWRQKIGYVPQEFFLFHDTLKRNISLGDESISSNDIDIAIEMAGAKEFVSNLPQGLNTIIGERGAMLSGGQRQRISIARALVRKPELLVLDEVTTSLDSKTEAEICQTLVEIKEKTTVLVISHQDALLDIADVIYKFNRKGIIEKKI